MKTRLEAFALAGILAVTVVTGGVALAGLKHGSPAQAPAPVAAQVVSAPAPTAAPPAEGYDD